MKQPFFTIITCTRNSEKYLPKCLKSLASQNFNEYEHIVIDGISTDTTLSLIQSISKIISLKPSGISAAMNEGIKQASGKYIYFLHSDDAFLDPHVLSQVAKYLQNNQELDWVYGQIQVVDAGDNKIGIFPKYKVFQLASSYLLKFFNFVPHQATFMKKSVFDQFGYFNTSFKTCMDYDYWLRICTKTNWSYMPILVANYRIHKAAQSSSSSLIDSNQLEVRLVQNTYLNMWEQYLASILNRLIVKVNKTTR